MISAAIKFTTPKGGTAVGEFAGGKITIRHPGIPVHWRNNPGDTVCPACGGFPSIWLDREWKHEKHPARCTLAAEAMAKAA